MSIQQLPDDIINIDETVYGEAVLSFGLQVRGAIDGIGLLTRGLVWHCPQLWTDTTILSGIATGWTGSATASSTSWTDASGASITTWTQVPHSGIWSEC
jgi:hypothetical protein